MLRLALRPRWLAWHLLLVVVLVSFGWLGRWQLGAYEHKGSTGPAQEARPAVALDALSRPGGRLGADELGRRVSVTGSYDRSGTRFVADRDRSGGSGTGLWVVAMLRTAEGVLPVVRGWVPDRDAPAAATPAGAVRLSGLLQRSEDGPIGPGVGAVAPDQLPYVATVTVLDRLPYRPGELYDGYLALRSEQPVPAARPAPVAAQDLDSGGIGRWRNLAYGLQWWLFAGAAVFFWWVVLRRAAEEQQEPEQPPTPPDAGPPSLVAPRRTT